MTLSNWIGLVAMAVIVIVGLLIWLWFRRKWTRIDGFEFVWITDGQGWHTARNNLEETFDVMEHVYCIADLENGVLERLFYDRGKVGSR